MSIVADQFRTFGQKLKIGKSNDNKENKPEHSTIIVGAEPLTDDLLIDAAQLEKEFWCPKDSLQTVQYGKS